MIWQEMRHQLAYLRPRTFNQDAIENLFGNIRSGCGSNDNPTVYGFVASLKTQIINGLTKQGLEGTNCEDDDASLLTNLRAFVEQSQDISVTQENVIKTTDTNTEVELSCIDNLSVAYVSGYIVKRILRNIACENCSKVLRGDKEEITNQFIFF